MKKMMPLHFLGIAILCNLVIIQPTRSENSCEEREKSLLSLDIAEDLITKAKDLFPNCTDATTNISECGAKEKASAYLDMIKKLISESKKYYPTCINPETKEPVTEEPETTETVSEEPETEEPIQYPKSRDCSEVLQNGQNVSGVYTIWPSSSLFPNRSLEVFCDMDTDGGGWMMVQRRGDFSPQENFYRDWEDYKNGFGNLMKDFWLGNDNLFVLSNQGKYKIRFDLESAGGEKAYAEYENFNIKDEKANYKLHIGGYKGNAGNSMYNDNGMLFSTKDRNNDNSGGSCAVKGKAGWWYNSCSNINPNGVYNPGLSDCDKSIHWHGWKGCVGLASIEIKIKSVGN